MPDNLVPITFEFKPTHLAYLSEIAEEHNITKQEVLHKLIQFNKEFVEIFTKFVNDLKELKTD